MREQGEPYRPSNGTEGMMFEDEFCAHCIHQSQNPDIEKNCEISMRACCFDLKDEQYPREWQYNALGHPCCTAFVNWDWGNDGDPDDPENPKAPPPPPDPRQLNLFPLYPTELTLTFENVTVQDRPSHCNHKLLAKAEEEKNRGRIKQGRVISERQNQNR